MKICFDGIVLRDPGTEDIDDEIRWTNTDTAWQLADTPWLRPEKIDPDALRAQMASVVTAPGDDTPRRRLEIEAEGRHAGMVTAYPAEGILQDGAEGTTALGIEICEKDLWGRGIGPRALKAFMDYRRGLGERRFLLETWSGNGRMLRCAEKLGFREIRRTKGAYTVNGRGYDALVLEKTDE